MPSNRTRYTIARQWQLLNNLPSKGSGKSVSMLTAELQNQSYKVEKRQVERDLKELSQIFAITSDESGKAHAWMWSPNANTDITGLTIAEALSLRMIEDTVRHLLPASVLQTLEGRFRLAKNTLDALQDGNVSVKWVNKVRSIPASLPLLPPQISPAVLSSIQEALLNEEQIDADYLSMGADRPLKIKLHPLGIVNKGVVPYLIATAWDFDDQRQYALHRFTRAERTYEPITRPEKFSLDVYLESGAMQHGNGKTIRLKALLHSEDLARILSESPISRDQEIKGNVLTATVGDSWELRYWIHSQTDSIEIKSPSSIRNEIKRTVNNMAMLYSGK